MSSSFSAPLFIGGVPTFGGGDGGILAGNVFFVDSGIGLDAYTGKSPAKAFATLDYAIGRCTVNNGDVIYVMPGHAETVAAAAGIDFDVAGITVIGIGKGSDRPTITMSVAASTVHFDAANTYLKNFLFLVEHDCTIVIDIDVADCTVESCEFRAKTSSTAREWVTCIDINGGTANDCDRTRILGCIFRSPTVGASNCIGLDEVAANVEIGWCEFWGDFSDACIHNPTGKILTQIHIHDNLLENTQTGDHSLELVSACTGVIAHNMYKNDMTQATGSDPGSCWNFENYHSDLIDLSGIISPAVT
jgi:hypothetical protein